MNANIIKFKMEKKEFTKLPVDGIVRLPHPRSGDSQGQETFLAPSAYKRTCNYDTECSNHHPSQSTLRSKRLSPQHDEMVSYIHANLPVNGIVRLPHSRSGDSQAQETFLAPSAFKRTRNYDTECSNHHPSQPTSRSKLLSRSMMK